MKLVVALLATASTAGAFTMNSNGVRSATQLNARQPIMAGNWKMNPATEADALNLANGFVALLNEMADTCAMDE